MLIGRKIFHFRKKICALSRESFAKIGGISPATLERYEAGKNLSVDANFISELKHHFREGLDLNWLLDKTRAVEIETRIAETASRYVSQKKEDEKNLMLWHGASPQAQAIARQILEVMQEST